jgi:hypothetical protein
VLYTAISVLIDLLLILVQALKQQFLPYVFNYMFHLVKGKAISWLWLRHSYCGYASYHHAEKKFNHILKVRLWFWFSINLIS